MATVGKFVVTLANGQISVEGPKAYMGSSHYVEAMKKIVAGESAVINYAPPGLSMEHLIAVALQTDYAGWKGFEEMMGWGPKAKIAK